MFDYKIHKKDSCINALQGISTIHKYQKYTYMYLYSFIIWKAAGYYALEGDDFVSHESYNSPDYYVHSVSYRDSEFSSPGLSSSFFHATHHFSSSPPSVSFLFVF